MGFGNFKWVFNLAFIQANISKLMFSKVSYQKPICHVSNLNVIELDPTTHLRQFDANCGKIWYFSDSYICSNSPFLNGRLPFWQNSSCNPVSSWYLPFLGAPGLNVRFLKTLQVDHPFYKYEVKILAATNEVRCVRCSEIGTYVLNSWTFWKTSFHILQEWHLIYRSIKII